MKVRLGYVSITNALDYTTSSTITYSNYIKINNKEEKIDDIIISNLTALEKIMIYNIKNNIHFYRLTSKLIPLSTHKDVKIEYINKYKKYYEKIEKLINDNNIRVDVHPDQFCVINSTNKKVIDNSFKMLEYHYNILNALNIKDKVIVLHVGSNVFGKEKSKQRFINNFKKLPIYIQECIALENDDKIFNIDDVLDICYKLDIRPVFDIHHYNCNKGIKEIPEYFKDIFFLWNKGIPKIHFSSPKSLLKKEYRSHNDYINVNDFINFLNSIKKYNKDIDIMLEVKQKDDALFRLVRQLKFYTDYKFLDDTTFIV